MLMAAACEGAGIALLPAADCREALAAGALTRVLPQWSGVDGILHLVFVSRRGMLPSVRAVIDFAAAALKSFMTKCEKDAAAKCKTESEDQKLKGAAASSHTKKCTTDAVGT